MKINALKSSSLAFALLLSGAIMMPGLAWASDEILVTDTAANAAANPVALAGAASSAEDASAGDAQQAADAKADAASSVPDVVKDGAAADASSSEATKAESFDSANTDAASNSTTKSDTSLDASANNAQDTSASDATNGTQASNNAQVVETSATTKSAAVSVVATSTSVAPKAVATTAAKDAASSSFGITNNGIYTIASALNSGKMVDVSSASKDNGARVQIYSNNTTAAQRWKFVSCGDGYYEIVSVNSGKALDVQSGKTGNSVAVQQYDRNGTKAQKWKVEITSSGQVRLVSALSSKYVLDLAGASTSNGAGLQIYQSNGTKAQLWILTQIKSDVSTGYYTIKNQSSGKSLDIAAADFTNGANAQQYTANSTMAQTFYLSYASSTGYYTVYAAHSGKVLDVASGVDANGANVQQYTSNGTAAQKWTLVKNSDGSYTFLSATGGKALDVDSASSKNGANVQIYKSNGTAAQKWLLTALTNWIPEGAYYIRTSVNSNNVVDAADGKTTAGTNVQVYAGNSTNAQRYYLTPTSGGYYTIQNTISGKYVAPKSASSGANVTLSSSVAYWKPVLVSGGIVFQSKNNSNIVLDVASGSSKSGANVQIYTYNKTAAQKFYLTETNFMADGTYRVQLAQNTNYVLDIDSGSTSNGAKLQIYQANGTGAQAFRFTVQGDGSYCVVNIASGKALTASNSQFGVTQQTYSSSTKAQRWRLGCNSGGAVTLTSELNSKVLDVQSNEVANGATVGVYTSNGTTAQQWVLSEQTISYFDMSITLKRMAELQKANSYYSSFSVSDLMSILNPDNCNSYSFLDVRVLSGATAAQLDAWIDSTASGRSGMLHCMGATFIAAAKQYGVNEVYLLAHAILESGWGTSKLAMGTTYNNEKIGSKYYTGTYYNFYGIGAYDTNANYYGGQAAAVNGWDTPAKAITGAAKWIANNYVYASNYAQPTLYAMKWDYARTNTTGSRGYHQYATGTTWANSIGQLIGQFYSSYGCSDSGVFITPRYA